MHMGVLVTGSGLLGSHIVRALQQHGEPVALLDLRHRTALLGRICNLASVSLITGDVTDVRTLTSAIRHHRIDRMVHTAAVLATRARADPPLAIKVNVFGTANVLEAARQCGVIRTVVASSAAVDFAIFRDFQGQAIPEDFCMRVLSQSPTSFYAATKLAGENLVSLYHAQHDVDAVSLRYGAVLGGLDAGDPGLVARLAFSLLQAWQERKPVRIEDPLLTWAGQEEFTDPRDCADATVKALFASHLPQRVYHIGSSQPVTLENFCSAARSAFPGIDLRVVGRNLGGFAGAPFIRPAPTDISAASRDLGFTPRHDLASTLRYFAESQLDNAPLNSTMNS